MSAQAIANTPVGKLKDNRGAIMVVGIFFACIMIGWMWMLVGLGDAMIWRDRSQEAADSISYSSAAIQAQGMNLISFINVLMLIMTAVYLLLSFVYNILDVLHQLLGSNGDASDCMQSSCGARQTDMEIVGDLPYMEWLEPIAQQWCNAARIVGGLHDGNTNSSPSGMSVGGILGTWETVMIDTMPILSKFEDFVAYAFPWAGELAGAYTATEYKDWGKSRWGVPISATLIPATTTPGQAGNLFPAKKYEACDPAEDEECTTPINCSSKDPNNCADYNGGDKREGLPVGIPDKGFTAICDYAGKKLVSEAKSAINSLIPGTIGSVVADVVGVVIGAIGDSFTSSYCETNSRGLVSGADDTIDFILPPATAIQGGGWNNNETCPHNDWGGGGGGGCGGPSACDHVYEMKLGNNQQFWHNPEFAGGPHLVVDYASNGNDWMQVWGAVWGGNRVEQSEKLVGVAGMDSKGSGTWNTVIPQNSETLFTLYISQSEFYFDCDDEWSADACNKDSNASYNISWRARLRRVHGLSWGSDLLNYLFNGSLGSTFDDKVTDIINGAMGSVFTNPIAGQLAKTAADQGYTALKDYTGKLVGSAINPASFVPDYIH